MSYVFGLNDQEKRQQLDTLTAGWDGQNDFSAGTMAGIPTGIGEGVMRGGARVGDLLQTIGSFYDEPTTDSDQLNTVANEFRQSSNDYWTPNINEVGKVGQVLGSVSEMALPLMAAGGNPALLGASTTISSGKDLIDQGVDAKTAGTAGLSEGGAVMLGAWLPIFGGTIGKRVLGNAVANTVVGAGTAGVESEILSGAGYDEQAKQYDPFDWQARAVDALMGAAFGAIHRGEQADMRAAVFGVEGAKRVQAVTDSMMESLGYAMKPSDMDAAFSAANIKHLQVDSAPGRPANNDSWSAHSNAMDSALRQLSGGEPVNVSVDNTEFHAKPQTDYQSSVDEVAAQSDNLDTPANTRAVEQPPAEMVPRETTQAPVEPVAPTTEQIETDAEIAAVQQHIQQHGDFDVAIAAGDDGAGTITRPASELLADADTAIQEANTMGKGIMAAAKCFLGFGE
jgi:hypothetical protein